MKRHQIALFSALCCIVLGGLPAWAVQVDVEEMARSQRTRENDLKKLQNTADEYSFTYMVIHVPPGMIPGISVSVPVTHVRYDSQVFFAFDSFSLQPESFRIISDFANFVKADSALRSIVVVGHTDSVGTYEYNQRLSLQRAAAVSARLHELGVDEAILGAVPMGEAQPIAKNSTEIGRSRNRRVEFFISEIEDATLAAIESLGFDPCFRREEYQTATSDVPCDAAVERIPVYTGTVDDTAPSTFIDIQPNVRLPLPNAVPQRPRLPVQ